MPIIDNLNTPRQGSTIKLDKRNLELIHKLGNTDSKPRRTLVAKQ
jgi:hypothetical protein